MRKADEESFRRFAVEHAARLRRSAYLFCGDWHLAEEVWPLSGTVTRHDGRAQPAPSWGL